MSSENYNNTNVVDTEVAEEDSVARQPPPVSTQLRLVSSKSLDKEVVLRKIRHRKCMNKVKNTFSTLMSLNNSAPNNAQEQKWVELGDAFSCP
ncbi:hypothetical protein vseg_004983 [Gypsophila vaccaria]